MPPIVWIDGTYHDGSEEKVWVFDHGLLYGDGGCEGIRVNNRRVFRLGQHIDRLYASAKGIWLEIPLAKPAMHRLVEEAVTKSGLDEAYIRLLVTRGMGDLGLDPRKCPTPSVICIVDTIQLWSPERYEKGLTALTAATPISHRESLSPRVKSLNYLSHILAKVEGIAAGVDALDLRQDVREVVERLDAWGQALPVADGSGGGEGRQPFLVTLRRPELDGVHDADDRRCGALARVEPQIAHAAGH